MCDNSLLLLPYDILVNIMERLNVADLGSVMATCKTLRNLVKKENAIWKCVYRKQLILRDDINYVNRSLKPISYYNKCRISCNWQKGCYLSKIILKHRGNYMPWLRLNNSDTLLLSLSSNLTCYSIDCKGIPTCKYFLWRVEVPTVVRNDVRTNDISRFAVKENIIVCGNRDGSAAIYTYDGRHKPKVLYHIKDCHNNGQIEVSTVECVNNKSNPCVITGSEGSSQLHLSYWKWPKNDYDPLPLLQHRFIECNIEPDVEVGVRSLAVNQSQDRLAIGVTKNSRPVVLDITKCKLLANIDHDSRKKKHIVRDITWHDENTIAFVTHLGTMQLFDTRTNKMSYIARDPFQSTLYCLKSDNHHAIVVGSNEYSRCVLFDVRNSQKHVQMYFTQDSPSPVYSLDFDSTRLIATTDRSTATLDFTVDMQLVEARDYSQPFLQY